MTADRAVHRRPAVTAVVPTAAIITIAFMGSVVVTPLYSLFQRSFGFSDITLTLVYAVYVVGNLAALLFLGQLSDLIGRKRVALPGLALAAASGLVFLLATSTVWLYAGRLLIGLAVGVLSGTGTAWLADHYGPDRGPTATVVAATANLVGIAIGPVLGGVLAEYVAGPLVTTFVVYLVLVAVVALAVARVPEPREVASAVSTPGRRRISLRPRLGVPPDRIRAFAAPAVAGFVTFALGGLYFALIPSIVIRDLHIDNVAVGGLIVCELATVAAACIVLGRRVEPGRAMLVGLTSLLPAVALVVAAQAVRSLPLLVVATLFAGGTMGFGYRGSLQVVNQIAPPDKRAQVASSYFIACFVGNSVPVIGVSVLTSLTDELVASTVFAATLGILALAAAWWHRRTAVGRSLRAQA